jgi:CBS-domain-containing membrane protein
MRVSEREKSWEKFRAYIAWLLGCPVMTHDMTADVQVDYTCVCFGSSAVLSFGLFTGHAAVSMAINAKMSVRA